MFKLLNFELPKVSGENNVVFVFSNCVCRNLKMWFDFISYLKDWNIEVLINR